MDDQTINDALHRRINQAVRDGAAQVVAPEEAPNPAALFDRFLANREAGRPLLEGLTLFRGSRDPDVDAGTFGAGFKHATPFVDIARGYAETANQNIGLRTPAAQGLGMLAEYALPPDALFVRNFGLEDQGTSTEGLTTAQIETLLAPLVDAYATAAPGPAQEQADLALRTFHRAFMYEVPVPADQAPLRQWVVQSSDHASRLLHHQDQGTLAEVMIDVVRERKLAVDAHGPAATSRAMHRGGTSGPERLDAFRPGLASVLTTVGGHIDRALDAQREQAYQVPLTSLSDALAWRRAQQTGMTLCRLTNSNTMVVHTHPALNQATHALDGLDAVEAAAYDHQRRPQQQALLTQLREARTLAQALNDQRAQHRVAQDRHDRLETTFKARQQARDQAAERLRELDQQHQQRQKAGFLARWRYRFGDQKPAQADLDRRRQALVVQDQKLERRATTCTAARAERDAHQALLKTLDDQVRAQEQRVRQQHREGELIGLPGAARNALTFAGRLTPQDWGTLASAAHRALRETDRRIAQGHRAVVRFQDLARTGLAPGTLASLPAASLLESPSSAPFCPAPLSVIARRVQEQVALRSPAGPIETPERPRTFAVA